MGGVAVVVTFGGVRAERQGLERMVTAAAYRGPDGASAWCDAEAALGVLALHASEQVVDRKSGACIVFDGRSTMTTSSACRRARMRPSTGPPSQQARISAIPFRIGARIRPRAAAGAALARDEKKFVLRGALRRGDGRYCTYAGTLWQVIAVDVWPEAITRRTDEARRAARGAAIRWASGAGEEAVSHAGAQ